MGITRHLARIFATDRKTVNGMRIINVNLQTGVGGGEVYTGFFLRALDSCGFRSHLIAHPKAKSWDTLAPDAQRIELGHADAIPEALSGEAPAWLVFHTLVRPETTIALQKQGHFVTCFAHMPLYGRNPVPLAAYDAIFPVSAHVQTSAEAAGLIQTYREPLYGIADLRTRPGNSGNALIARSPYDWDKRKFRDRVFGALEPLKEKFRTHTPYVKNGGITLGIVSRLTTIKQFPELFSLLAPIIARHAAYQVEIFGSGGYASVRDLRHALAPLGSRARFWGHQTSMPEVYSGIDYLMTGLPEKEALGLNVIEAQACGTPVLAVNAPPFTETVAGEISGLFYCDPRKDQGVDFARILKRLQEQPLRIDETQIGGHLARFSETAFTDRVARAAAWAEEQLAKKVQACAS